MLRGLCTHLHVARSPRDAVHHLTGDTTRRASQMREGLHRTREGSLRAFPLFLLCAAGRHPTEMAALRLGSRSSVDRIVRAYRPGSRGVRIAPDGQRSVAVRTTGWRPWLTRSLGAFLNAAPRP